MANYNNTLLISTATLKSNSLINDNVDGVYILPAITLAQDVGLQSLIGTKLYRKLQALVATAEITLEPNAQYKLLLDDYIANYLTWQTVAEIQVPLNFKNVNKGIVTTPDEKVYPTSLRDLNYLVDHYKNKAAFFASLLTNYLVAHSKHYPEYSFCSSDGGLGASDDFNCPIYL